MVPGDGPWEHHAPSGCALRAARRSRTRSSRCPASTARGARSAAHRDDFIVAPQKRARGGRTATARQCDCEPETQFSQPTRERLECDEVRLGLGPCRLRRGLETRWWWQSATCPKPGAFAAANARHQSAFRASSALRRQARGARLRSTWGRSSGSMSPSFQSPVSAIALPSVRRAHDCRCRANERPSRPGAAGPVTRPPPGLSSRVRVARRMRDEEPRSPASEVRDCSVDPPRHTQSVH